MSEYEEEIDIVRAIVSGGNDITNVKLSEFMVSDFVKDRPAIINLVLLHAVARILRNVPPRVGATEDIESSEELVVEQNDENSFEVSGTIAICPRADSLHHTQGWSNGNCTLKGNDVKSCKSHVLERAEIPQNYSQFNYFCSNCALIFDIAYETNEVEKLHCPKCREPFA